MFRNFCIALLSVAGVLAAGPAAAGLIEGKVIEISDGATLTVLSSEGSSLHRVRLAGISVPTAEAVLGSRARENLRRLTRGKTVRVDAGAIDSAGQLLGTVAILGDAKPCAHPPCKDSLDPGELQLSQGYAVVDKGSIGLRTDELQNRYVKAEAYAKTHKRGVWKSQRPVVSATTDYEANAGVYPLRQPAPLTGRR